MFSARFDMKGVVLALEDLVDSDWADKAGRNGVNTILLQGDPDSVSEFVASEKGQDVDIEYLMEVRNMPSVRPCVHSSEFLDAVVAETVSDFRTLNPEGHKCYPVIDGSYLACTCQDCSKYSYS